MKKLLLPVLLFFVLTPAAFAEPQPSNFSVYFSFTSLTAGESQAKADLFIQTAKSYGWDVKVESLDRLAETNYEFKPGETLEDVVVNKLQGCKTLDAACEDIIKRQNTWSESGGNKLIARMKTGQFLRFVLLPTNEKLIRVSIFAGNEHRSENIELGSSQGQHNVTTVIISRRLNDLLSQKQFDGILTNQEQPGDVNIGAGYLSHTDVIVEDSPN